MKFRKQHSESLSRRRRRMTASMHGFLTYVKEKSDDLWYELGVKLCLDLFERENTIMYKHLATSTRYFKKGETILRQGEKTEFLYLLKSGSCYRYLFTDKGDTIIYEIKKPDGSLNSLIGVLTLYNQEDASHFTFVARTQCECLCIPAKDFVEWAADKPTVQNELVCLAMTYYNELRIAYQSHQEGRIANRLCRILLECIKSDDSSLIITKKYNFSEMAAMLGIHPVTVSRIVRSLCEEKTLAKDPDALRVVNIEKLLAYAGNKEPLIYK